MEKLIAVIMLIFRHQKLVLSDTRPVSVSNFWEYYTQVQTILHNRNLSVFPHILYSPVSLNYLFFGTKWTVRQVTQETSSSQIVF